MNGKQAVKTLGWKIMRVIAGTMLLGVVLSMGGVIATLYLMHEVSKTCTAVTDKEVLDLLEERGIIHAHNIFSVSNTQALEDFDKLTGIATEAGYKGYEEGLMVCRTFGRKE